MKRYVSNEDKSARMFDSDSMELFTHIHPALPLVIFVPVVFYSLYVAQAVPGSMARIELFVSGLLFWTLTEYVLHREVFHFIPDSEWGKRLHFIMHGVHHDYPNDSRRLVMAPAISVPLSILFFLLFRGLLGAKYCYPFFAGFITGYLCYDMMHFAIHHFPMKGRLGSYLRRHHLRHHYLDADINYGVSTPLWDVVFRTLDDEKKARRVAAGVDLGVPGDV
ncbi:MAG TPA: sterol desaturase family protein [Bacteroidota bacterium]|nr:sterol desaturase family protein [Bacteroidota bacterium]